MSKKPEIQIPDSVEKAIAAYVESKRIEQQTARKGVASLTGGGARSHRLYQEIIAECKRVDFSYGEIAGIIDKRVNNTGNNKGSKTAQRKT